MAVKATASITLIRVNDADTIEIGGRNYILNSQNLEDTDHLDSEPGSRKEYMRLNVGQSYMGIPGGTQVTISFDLTMQVNTVEMESDPNVPMLKIYNSNTGTRGPKWFDMVEIELEEIYPDIAVGDVISDRISVQTTIRDCPEEKLDSENNWMEFYSIYGTSNWFKIENLKLEKGNRPSDWTPAPEDTDQKLDDQKVELQSSIDTAIETSEEGIINTVTETFTTKDDFQTEVGLLQTQLTQTQEDFTFQFNTVNSSLTDLDAFKGEAGTQLDTISKYIRFLNGDILLGGSDSDVQLKIENDRIAFLDNNNEVMYISNEELYIMRAIIATQLTIGNFSWVPRSNGNVSFRYIGD